ncbi:MAG: dihydrolipoamide acetyltransferase family protein, partial [Acidimicrobiia bacterium]
PAPSEAKEEAPPEPLVETPPSKPKQPAAEALPQEPQVQPAADGRRQIAASEEEPRRGILSPLVRKMAAEAGVDLELVKGSGTGGRITKQDVLDFVDARRSGAAPQAPAQIPAGAPAAQPPAAGAVQAAAPARPAGAEPVEARPVERAPAATAGDEVVEMTHMRKAIADHMVKSHLTTARAWNAVEVDLTKVGTLRQLAGQEFRKREGFSLTWMPFVAKAICQSLLRFPQVNSTWNEDGTITRKHYVNLGIAVALENGLIVPVVKGADGMNLSGLARSIRDIASRARSKKLNPDEVHGGTFTITNPGPFGSLVSLPIINQGQTGILAFDAVVKRPVVVTDENGNDAIAIRQMVFLSMSWDHRVIDGAEAAQFLSQLKQLLEEADFESDLTSYLPDTSKA